MTNHPFTNLPRTAESHFKLYFYATVMSVIEKTVTALGGFEEAFEQFPFLAGYSNELAGHGIEGMTSEQAGQWWRESLLAWEAGGEEYLPLQKLREAASLDYWSL